MAQHIQSGILQLIAKLGADYGTAGKNSNILQHSLSSVAVAGSLYSHYIESTAQLIYDQCGQSLSFHILGNDQQLSAGLNHLLQQRQNLLNIGNLFVRNQNAGVIENRFHLVHIRCHICRDITSVKLHTFYQIQLGLHGLRLFDGDNTVTADFFHCVRNQLSYFVIPCGNSGHSRNMLLAVYLLAHLGNGLNSTVGSLFHTFSQDNGICACRKILHARIDHRLSQNGCGGSTVTCHVIGLGSHFLHQLGAHIFECVLQLDLLCDGNAVVGDQGSAERLIQYYVSSFGSKGYSDGICQLVYTGL